MTISACVLVFGLCVMLMSARALLRGIPAAAVLRLFGMLTNNHRGGACYTSRRRVIQKNT